MKHTFFLLIIFCVSCSPQKKEQPEQILDHSLENQRDGMYNFNLPDATFILSDELLEISGLSVFDAQQLIAVNDELGFIYFINKQNGVVEHKQKFGPKGDYESIEKVADILYVLQNNGDLFRYNFTTQQDLPVIKTALKSKNDLEGMTYDKANNRLLFAAKGKPYIGSKKKENVVKSIYAFDLTTDLLDENPIIEIADSEIEEYALKQESFIHLTGFEQTTFIRRIQSYAPSAIAIHPMTNEYYLLSSRGKMIIILNSETHQIKEIVLLDEFVHTQPEGLCFDSNGDMFISNEGKSRKAKLMVYRY